MFPTVVRLWSAGLFGVVTITLKATMADDFSDPRARSTRRGRGRGRGERGKRGGRGGKRGRSVPRTQQGASHSRQQELGSNEYRFREREDEESDDFDAGKDFEEAAAGKMTDDPQFRPMDPEQFVPEFQVNLDSLNKALGSVPLWVRLGEFSRFCLDVPEDDVIDNYLTPLPSDEENERRDSRHEPDERADKAAQEFARELANLNFDDEEDKDPTSGREDSTAQTASNATDVALGKEGNRTGNAVVHEELSLTKNSVSVEVAEEEKDDFDQWLDDV